MNARANLATLVEQFRAHSAETAVVAHRGNRRYATTYGELASLAGRFSAELERRNIVPGDRVVLWGENSAEWIAAFFGCILRGVIAVPLDAAGDPGFAARVIRDTAPKLIVGDTNLLASLGPHLKGEMGGTQSATENLQPATPQLALATLAAHLPATPFFTPSETIQPYTPFQIVFTSGTTSEPRGIVHTHRNILVTLEPIEREMQKYLRYERIFHPLRFLHSIPLSHVFGQFMGLWIPALLAAEVHFAEELEPSRLVALLRRERISVLIAVPRVLSLLRAHLLSRFPTLATQIDQSAGLSILKRWWYFRRIHSALGWKFWAVISGGATLPAELETFWNRLGYALIQGYGMTETAALVTLNHPFHIKAGSIGKPMPGREVRISPDGEILVRGAMLAEATWQGGQLRPREGEWLSTGDLAEQSATGELKFLGRKGDVIVTSAGLNIHPADLESALAAQPGIRAVVVVPCDLAAGPEPIAVLLSTLPDPQLQAAVDAANRTLAEYQQMRRVLRWPQPQFPYTSTGKLIRREVTAWACEVLTGSGPLLSSRSAAEGSASPTDALLATIASVTSEPIPNTPNPDALRLSEDLHLDSLGRVQLQSALEHRFSVDLDDDALAAAQTVADLRSLMEADSSQLSVVSSQSISSPQPPTASPQPTTAPPLTTDPSQLNPHLYPRWPWSWPIQTLRVLWVELILRPLVWFFAAPRVIYAPGAASQLATCSLQPATPCLILSNHITAYDGALILYALPRLLRHRVAAAMSGEMLLDYRNRRNQGNWFLNLLAPAAYWLLTALFNVFPLPRAKGFRRSFAHAGEALDRGYSVLIFPEGSRSHTGHINAFRPGIGLLARQSHAPILPVALLGLYEATAPQPTTRRRWFHSGSIEVRLGPVIPAPAEDADPAQLTATLEQALRALLFKPS